MFLGKKIISIKQIKESREVYDLEIKDAHHYLFENGVVSHNSGPYAGKEQGGGSGSKYAASLTVSLSKAKEKDGDSVIGSAITCTLIKSRLVKEQTKVRVLIRFNGGLDRYFGLIDLAERCGAFKKVSTKYEMPDGKKYFEKTIMKNPQAFFTTDILNSIDEYVQREFMYGGSNVEPFNCEQEESETDE